MVHHALSGAASGDAWLSADQPTSSKTWAQPNAKASEEACSNGAVAIHICRGHTGTCRRHVVPPPVEVGIMGPLDGNDGDSSGVNGLKPLDKGSEAAALEGLEGVNARADPTVEPTKLQKLQAFVIKNYLLLALAFCVLISLSWPLPGRTINSWMVGSIHIVQVINNVLVFLISGLTLRTEDIRSAIRLWPVVLLGCVLILGVTPCLGFATRLLPINPPEFVVGLTIFCVVPTTLGVGVVLVGASRGNQALALILTVFTNLLGIATVPFLLRAVLSDYQGLSVKPLDLCLKLVLTVLVPTTLGKAASACSTRVAAFVKEYKVSLSIFSTSNLVLIMWQTLSSAREQLVHERAANIFAIGGLAIGQHVLYLLAVGAVVLAMRLPPREGVALLIMSAQKSAPVAVTVISYITKDAVQQGLFAVPALCGQVTQIFIGSLLARFLSSWIKKQRLENTDR